jgi:hypothetical protein
MRFGLKLFEKAMPEWLYAPGAAYSGWRWVAVGATSYALSEIFITLSNETHNRFPQFILSWSIAFVPCVMNQFRVEFKEHMALLADVFWYNDSEFAMWMKKIDCEIFTLNASWAKFSNVAILLSGQFTVMKLGLPYQSGYLNSFLFIEFSILMIIYGQAPYVLISLLKALRELSNKVPVQKFNMLPHPALTELQAFYSKAALLVTFAYVTIVLAIWKGPYEITFDLQLWLTLLAAFPISMFCYSVFKIHKILRHLKLIQLISLNKRAQHLLQESTDGDTKESLERAQIIISIYDKINTMHDWPIAVQGAFTFLVSSSTLVAQILISFLKTH